jgi:pyrophosphate--fructose-6-phosphate 1-phosphotransferase
MEKMFTVDLPSIFKGDLAKLAIDKNPDTLINISKEDEAKIQKFLPASFTKDVVSFIPKEEPQQSASGKVVVAVVFSGGPAPGGHNVVCGLYYAVKKLNPESKVIGCIEGFTGLLEGRFMEIKQEDYDKFLNTGGFDMLGSARVKITTNEQIDKCVANLNKEGVTTLLTIGGDDSNTNAAILAEKFLAKKIPIQVIGIPKTIDGDLKNKYTEQSFGFDTATSIYSYQIGNICRDAKSSMKYWHIIKLMGRDTGHICLECALRTHPNIAIIGEEVKDKNRSMKTVVHHICDGIISRSEKGENFGVVLFSEGIVENCAEMYQLLKDIDDIKQENLEDYKKLQFDREREAFIISRLGARNKESEQLYKDFPTSIKYQFLIDKDAHGHFQCARIDSENLFVHLIKQELKTRNPAVLNKFNSIHHSFGYEGRCGWPTKFDDNYSYSLGITGALLIVHGFTGYLASVRKLVEDTENWIPSGVPLCLLMNPESGKDPRIKAIRIDLKSAPFIEYYTIRGSWKDHSNYLYPLAPHQFGPKEIIDKRTCTLHLEHPKK